MHNYKVRYSSQIEFEVKPYEHIHNDKISIMMVNDINRRTEIKEDSEDEDDYEVNVPFEIEGCYGYGYD